MPMPDAYGAVKELDRAVSDLGFVGALNNGHVGGRYMDDPRFWPVYERAEALGVPIHPHPNRPPQAVVDAGYSGLPPVVGEALATAGRGWHIGTGLHVLRLIVDGVFDRFPRLQVVIGHLGEAVPSMIWRASWTAWPASTVPSRTTSPATSTSRPVVSSTTPPSPRPCTPSGRTGSCSPSTTRTAAT
ncbi:amidohydrolase family protein [Streptomyces ipomoeae]|uniref:amidohydrolase family protein n=1 Tax=Streptomyces ipomoeae TaxID=103232 RepID=UPI0038D3BAB0